MRRPLTILLLAALIAVPALAKPKKPSPQRAVPGAGWSAVTVSGNGGAHIYKRYCFECHDEGPDMPGTAALQVKYKGEMPALLHKRNDLGAQFVIYTVRHGVSVMPSMRKTEISDAELKAIAAYLSRGKE